MDPNTSTLSAPSPEAKPWKDTLFETSDKPSRVTMTTIVMGVFLGNILSAVVIAIAYVAMR